MTLTKKILTGLLVAASAFGMTGCGYVQDVAADPQVLVEDIVNGIDSIDKKIDDVSGDSTTPKTDTSELDFNAPYKEELTPIQRDASGKVIFKEPLRGTLIDAPTSHDNVNTSRENDVFYRIEGEAQVTHNVVPQEMLYGKLDGLGRATGAWGMITDDMFEHSAGNPRYEKEYKQNPSGWKNKKVKIKTSNNEYNGYFYNRSHLIGDLIGGRFFEENVVTGTRMQNVGWNGNNGAPAGGMAYSETKVANHFKQLQKENDGKPLDEQRKCNVYYSAVPNYIDDELVPRTVTVDMLSCDGTINEHVIVSNTAPGYNIDYATGAFTKK